MLWVSWRRIVDKLLQLLNQSWRKAAQLIAVQQRELAQRGSAAARETDPHPTAVDRIGPSFYQAARLQAIDQANSTVVANLQPVSQVSKHRPHQRETGPAA